MIIAIRGTDSNENKAAHMTATLATLGAIRRSRKTLIMQLNKGASIEDLLIGKRNAEVDIKEIGFMYEDTGMDALMMRVGTLRIQKEHFDACCSSVLDEDNMLDIAGPSKRDNFEEVLLESEDKFETLLEQAKEVYDDIYLYVNGQNEELLKMLEKYTDTMIVCVRQGKVEKVTYPYKDSIYLITNYDKNSVYSIRSLKKDYGVQRMYGMPYCSEYKDAYNDGNILGFMGKNEKISENDINFLFINSLNNILNLYITEEKVEEKENEELPEPEEKDDWIEPESLEEYKEPEIEVVEERKGFKKKNKVVEKPDNVPIATEETELIDEEELDSLEDEDESKIEEDIAAQEEVNIPVPKPSKASVRKEKKILRKAKAEKVAKRSVAEPAAVSESSDEWVCPNCNNANIGKAKFCMECGEAKPAPTEWTCPECGEINPPKAKFCMECGYKA